jgi:Domain of unknown function (DUF4907)
MHNPNKMYFQSHRLKCLLIVVVSLSTMSFLKAQDSNQKSEEHSSLNQTILSKNTSASQLKRNIYFFVKEAPDDRFGFNIYIDGIVVMDQTTIPGRPNGKGYSSFLSAENVAKFLVDKLKSGEGKIEISDEALKKLIVD